MKIQNVTIANFRSIEQMSFALSDINVICGPNSCGKSNLFKAINLALAEDIDANDYASNIPRWIQSGRAMIRVELIFSDLPDSIKGIAKKSKTLRYKFYLGLNGKIKREFDIKSKSADELFELVRNSLMLTFVPAIRDWSSDGLATFQKVLLNALLRSRGNDNLNGISQRLKQMLDQRSPALLNYQKEAANKLFRADSMQLDTSSLNLDFISSQISLKIKKGHDEILLDELGTGHQSALIMGLYQQLGESQGKTPLFIFEEPDNHLHPATIRSVVNDLISLSKKTQVLISTHSPLVLSNVDFSNILTLDMGDEGRTTLHSLENLISTVPQKEIRIFLEKYGIRATEPLLAKRVVIVEGLTDRTFVSKIFELQYGRTIDSENYLIIPAGGKDEAVKAAKIMDLMGVECRILFDWDATSIDPRKHFISIENEYEKTNMIEALRLARGYIDSSHKRGNNSKKELTRLVTELEGVAAKRKDSYQDSPIFKIVQGSSILNLADKLAIKSAVRLRKTRKLNELLAKENAHVLKADLEDFFVAKSDIATVAEDYLVKLGRMAIASGRSHISRNGQIRNLIHDMAHEPELLEDLIVHVFEKTKFKGTGLMACIKFLFE